MITIEEAFSRAKNTEEFSLSKIAIPEEQYFYYGFLEHPNLVYGCFNIKYKNFNLAKNNFYITSVIILFRHNKYDNGTYTGDNIFTTHYGFCYSLISDSPKLINRYLQYEDTFLDTFGSSFAKAIQACVKGDDDSLQEQIKNLEKHTDKKSIAKNYSGVPIAFKGILQNDKTLVEQGINEILAKHGKQEQPAVVKDYMNIEALTLAKLAYRKGIVIEIDNPLLPKEMIPIQELDKYESYDFLKDIEAAL
jgi:hypothetical protein